MDALPSVRNIKKEKKRKGEKDRKEINDVLVQNDIKKYTEREKKKIHLREQLLKYRWRHDIVETQHQQEKGNTSTVSAHK